MLIRRLYAPYLMWKCHELQISKCPTLRTLQFLPSWLGVKRVFFPTCRHFFWSSKKSKKPAKKGSKKIVGPLLGYWATRGRVHPIRMLLSHAGVSYEEKRYIKKSDWQDERESLGLPFPNLPYFIDKDVKLTQSAAIIKYLGRKYGLDGSTDSERRLVDQVLFEAMDVRDRCLNLAYMNANEYESAKQTVVTDFLPEKLKLLADFLKKQDFFATEKASCVDFVVYETLMLCLELEPSCLDKHKNLVNFLIRIEKLPNIAKYISRKDVVQLPFNAPSAHYGLHKPAKPQMGIA